MKWSHFVMSYMKQNKKRKQTLESTQYGLQIIFKSLKVLLNPCFEQLFKKKNNFGSVFNECKD